MKWCILAESDNESAPTQSPVKTTRSVKVKTLEEIRLEKVQAESAAYYSYPGKFLLMFIRAMLEIHCHVCLKSPLLPPPFIF